MDMWKTTPHVAVIVDRKWTPMGGTISDAAVTGSQNIGLYDATDMMHTVDVANPLHCICFGSSRLRTRRIFGGIKQYSEAT